MLASSHLYRDNLALCERSLPAVSAVPYIPALHSQRFPTAAARPPPGLNHTGPKSPLDRVEDAPDARRGSQFSYYSDDTQERFLAPPPAPTADMANHLQYPAYSHDPDYSRAPSAAPSYPDDRRVSSSSTGSYEQSYYPYRAPFQPPARATPPVMSRGTLPYEYPVEQAWAGRRPSAEQSPAPSARYDEYHEEQQQQQQIPYPLQPLEHPSPMASLGSSSSNSTGIPASPELASLPSGLPGLPEGAHPPSGTNPGQRTYAFVSLAGSTIRKRPRRRYDEIERLYSCSFEDCTKAYGTLNHLNAHVTMQKHGSKRNPSEFKELRKLWRTQKKAEQMANRPRRRRGVGQDDEHGLHRSASGSYSSPAGYSDDSDEGTPQPVDAQPHYGVDQMWPQDMIHHSYGMPAMEENMERIPPNATLLQSLPSTHPSQQHQYSGSMHQMYSGPMLTRRASDHEQYDYHRGPSGYGR